MTSDPYLYPGPWPFASCQRPHAAYQDGCGYCKDCKLHVAHADKLRALSDDELLAWEEVYGLTFISLMRGIRSPDDFS